MFLRQYNSLFILLLLLPVVLIFLLFNVKNSYAHSPHDVIEFLEISPNYDQDKTLFMSEARHLKKSSDGGFSWKYLGNGLDNIHRFTSIAISPSFNIDKTLFVSSDGDGIYRSQDGGTSWIKVNNGLYNLKISLLSISSVNYNEIIMAAGSEKGLYKTKNGGKNWYQVIDDIEITAIAFFPVPENDYIIAGDDRGNIYLSADVGETWEKRYQIANSDAITSFAITPNVSSDVTFFVGTEKKGVFKTVNSGESFFEISNGLPAGSNIISLAISSDFGKDATIFASTWYKAIFKSTDGGKTWKEYNYGLTTDSQADSKKYRSPHFTDVKIPKTFSSNGTVFLGGFNGLFKSSDGGQHWTQMETMPVSLIMGLAVSQGDKDCLTIIITTYGGGAYKTDDQGLTWSVKNNGLRTTRLSDIVFSPNYRSDNTIFSASRGYLLKSIDRGTTWNRISLALESWRTRLIDILRRIRFPSDLLKIVKRNILTLEDIKPGPFATVIALSPSFASDNTLYFGTRSHGIFKSNDGGINNSIVWDANGGSITSLIISPDFSSDRTLFAHVRGDGVFKTEDGGYSWKKLELSYQSTQKNVKLVISPNYKTDKTVFAGSTAGLFKTIDGGKNWQQLKVIDNRKDTYILSMAISQNFENDKELIVSVKSRGLFKSVDGGVTFDELSPALINNNHEIRWIKFSKFYSTDDTIYAASYEELFQSVNNGNTWEIIKRPVRYENHRDVIHYEGEWAVLRGDDFSATSISYSNVADNKATLNYVGTGINWIGTTSNDQGIARVYIDNRYMADVDQFNNNKNFMVDLFSITDLSYGPHKITIEVTSNKNSRSAGYRIEIDAFDIVP